MDRQNYIINKYKIDTSGNPPYRIELSRWKDFPPLFNEMEIKEGAEIGVERGKYAEWILNRMPGLKLHCIDCWESYGDYRPGWDEKIAGYYEETKRRLAGKNCEIIRAYSLDAVKKFQDESLDLVFIDGNHEFRQVIDDIDEWSKKVKKGGVIWGHDYMTKDEGYERVDVEDAVNAWTKSKGIKVWFVLWDSERGRCPSWMWIK